MIRISGRSNSDHLRNIMEFVPTSSFPVAQGDSLGFTAEDVPNVFTPNGDNKNDYFEVETSGDAIYDLIIFTRTGTKIYDCTSPRIFWDGRNSGGNEVSEGIYYYIIKLTGKPSSGGLSGFVYLYR